jgi:hypothetical protein
MSEESLTKARNFLHGLVQAGWVEMDKLIIEAKEFEDRNRGTYQQVVADIARLGSICARLRHEVRLRVLLRSGNFDFGFLEFSTCSSAVPTRRARARPRHEVRLRVLLRSGNFNFGFLDSSTCSSAVPTRRACA